MDTKTEYEALKAETEDLRLRLEIERLKRLKHTQLRQLEQAVIYEEGLKTPLKPGGLLHAGQWVKARDLRDSSRAWRRLIEDLFGANQDYRQTAESHLHALGVVYRPSGRGFEFSVL